MDEAQYLEYDFNDEYEPRYTIKKIGFKEINDRKLRSEILKILKNHKNEICINKNVEEKLNDINVKIQTETSECIEWIIHCFILIAENITLTDYERNTILLSLCARQKCETRPLKGMNEIVSLFSDELIQLDAFEMFLNLLKIDNKESNIQTFILIDNFLQSISLNNLQSIERSLADLYHKLRVENWHRLEILKIINGLVTRILNHPQYFNKISLESLLKNIKKSVDYEDGIQKEEFLIVVDIFEKICSNFTDVISIIQKLELQELFQDLIKIFLRYRLYETDIGKNQFNFLVIMMSNIIPSIPNDLTILKLNNTTGDNHCTSKYNMKHLLNGICNKSFMLDNSIQFYFTILKIVYYTHIDEYFYDFRNLSRLIISLLNSKSLEKISIGLSISTILMEKFESNKIFLCELYIQEIHQQWENLCLLGSENNCKVHNWIKEKAASLHNKFRESKVIEWFKELCKVKNSMASIVKAIPNKRFTENRDRDIFYIDMGLPIIEVMEQFVKILKTEPSKSELCLSGILDVLLDYILPDISKIDLDEHDWQLRYSRLRLFVRLILEVPEDIGTAYPVLLRTNLFKSLIKHCQGLGFNLNYKICPKDLMDHKPFTPSSPSEVELCVFRNENFDRVLGPSSSPELLVNDKVTKMYRLISILYVVNEEWGFLFGIETKRCISSRDNFIDSFASHQILLYENDSLDGSFFDPNYIIQNAKQYPFFFEYYHRMLCFGYPRKTLKKSDSELSESLQYINDCQKRKSKIWIAELQTKACTNNDEYVYSPNGLYPSPSLDENLDKEAAYQLFAFGESMADELIYRSSVARDIFVNKILIKQLATNPKLGINDVKEIMPSLSNFIDDLIKVWKEVESIKCNNEMTIQDKEHIISSLNLNGCTFQNLNIKFTLPEFPEIELKSGGSEINLEPNNIDEYLKLLVWWFLYEGPKLKLKALKNVFNQPLYGYWKSISLLYYPRELQNRCISSRDETWTTEFLEKHIKLVGYTLQCSTIKFLFKWMQSLKKEEYSDPKHKFLFTINNSDDYHRNGLSVQCPPLTIVNSSIYPIPTIVDSNYTLMCQNTLFIKPHEDLKSFCKYFNSMIKSMQQPNGTRFKDYYLGDDDVND